MPLSPLVEHKEEVPLSVLYVEDDEADVALMERACTTLELDLHVARCADDAATVLRTGAAKKSRLSCPT